MGLDQLAYDIYDAFSNRDYDAIDRLFSDDYVDHAEFPGISQDREGVKQFIRMFSEACPDLHFEVLDVLLDGNRAAVRNRMTGTNTGPFMGMPPTGNQISVEGVDIGVMNDQGQCCEHWGYFEEAKMMQQFGMMPVPEQRTVDVSEQTTART